MTIDDSIDLFFTSPSTPPTVPGKNSTLYLLRRDVSTCFGVDPGTGSKTGGQAFFPGVMAILAGIDLLAKFKYGDSPSEVGKRYKDFVKEYISADYGKELYQLRNAMLHSFGLYSENSQGKKFKFTVTINTPALVEKHGTESYYVNIKLLWEALDISIGAFKDDISMSTTLRNRFQSMFEKYGYISIGG